MNLLRFSVLFNCLFFSVAQHSKDVSMITSPISRLTLRQKRALLLPNYGSIKLTIGLSKALLGNIPRGLSLSYELCSYFAGPTVVSDLFDGILPKKPKSPMVMKSPKRKNFVIEQNTWKGSSLQQNYKNVMTHKFYTPASNYYYKQALKKTFMSNNKLRRSLSSGSSVLADGISALSSGNPLRKVLEFILGSNTRCAALMSVCRSKDLLFPPGYSMLQDIIRMVIFENEKNSISDGISEFCKNEVLSECGKETFDLIQWFLNPK